MSNRGRPTERPRRGPLALAGILVIAVAAAGGFVLFRTQAAGENPTPVSTSGVTAVASPTPGGTAAASPTPTVPVSASPTPTPYPSSLAESAVKMYWDYIGSSQFKLAYGLLSQESQANLSEQDFALRLGAFLRAEGGIGAKVGTATVRGDRAIVPVDLVPGTATGPVHSRQHLIWEAATWRIVTSGSGR